MTVDLKSLEILQSNERFSKGDAKLILTLVREYRDELWDKWREYHGE